MGGCLSATPPDMPKHFTHFIGCQVQTVEGDVAGCFFDLRGVPWMPDEAKEYMWQESLHTRKDMALHSAKGLMMYVPQGFSMDHEFHGIPETSTIGVYDSKTRTIKAEGSIKVAMDKKGKFAADTIANISKLVSSGNGQIAYSYFLPCARISTRRKLVPQKCGWVSGVIVGAKVEGNMCVEDFGAGGSTGGVSASVGIDVSTGVHAAVKAGGGKDVAGRSFVGAFEQVGGTDIDSASWTDRPLHEFLNYLHETWRKRTLSSPGTWVVQRVFVREAEANDERIQAQEASSPHVVTVGRMGVGKSKFLSTLASGVQSEVGGDLFASGASKANMSSVTKDVETKTVLANFQDGAKSTLLTDVPGFGDPRRFGDEQTVQSLMVELGTPGRQTIHALVLVEKFGETRFSESHLKFLGELERNFGERMWDYFVIMLTHFQEVAAKSMSQNLAANQKAGQSLLEEKKTVWLNELSEWFPASRNRLGNNKNIVFAIDSVAIQMSNDMTTLQKTQKANVLTAWFGEWSKNQLQSFVLLTQIRLKNNMFLRVVDAFEGLSEADRARNAKAMQVRDDPVQKARRKEEEEKKKLEEKARKLEKEAIRRQQEAARKKLEEEEEEKARLRRGNHGNGRLSMQLKQPQPPLRPLRRSILG